MPKKINQSIATECPMTEWLSACSYLFYTNQISSSIIITMWVETVPSLIENNTNGEF